MLIDSHCHLDLIDLQIYENSFSKLLETISAQGISHMLCVSVDLDSYHSMLELVEHHSNISISVGVHPCDKNRHEVKVDELVMLASHERNVAIGETGLDYFKSEDSIDWQKKSFCAHIEAAKKSGKPLIVHTRDAREDTINILEQERASDIGGVMHCFTESWEMAEAALDMGFYISFSGIVTFKNAQNLRDVAKRVPMDRLLIETDSPYLAPVPHRGKPNSPALLGHVASAIAEVKSINLSEVINSTNKNFCKLFSNAKIDL